jgi:glucosamine-6-phosphate deaminase
MRLITVQDRDAVCLKAAGLIADMVRSRTRCVLGLPTGGTAVGVYRELAAIHEEGLSFAGVVTFNLDEYLGLSCADPHSYHRFMAEHFFDKVDIKKDNIHIPDGAAADPDAECAGYERKILEAGGIDLLVGGTGENGHIAFNEPFSSLASRTRVVPLSGSTLRANSRFFGGGEPPRKALTMGIGTILDAKQVLIIAVGKGKAEAVRAGLEGPISHACPISALQLHRDALMLCDEEAASGLNPETRAYFAGQCPQ